MEVFDQKHLKILKQISDKGSYFFQLDLRLVSNILSSSTIISADSQG